MLIEVLDANGVAQTVWVPGQGDTSDFSSTITTDNESQELVAANLNRSYIYFYNRDEAPMYINDKGDADPDDPASFLVPPGQSWPPYGYPIPTGAINVSGTAGQKFTCRESS